MTIKKAKNKYNELLPRFHKANEYFERTDITNKDKETYLPQFQKVLSSLSYLLSEIKVYTQQEAMEGFHE